MPTNPNPLDSSPRRGFTTSAVSTRPNDSKTSRRALRVVSLGKDSKVSSKAVASVQLLGNSGKLDWTQQPDALVIKCPSKMPCEHAVAFKITFAQ